MGRAGKLLHQFHFSRMGMSISIFTLAIALAAFGYGVKEYIQLHGEATKVRLLKQALAQQTDQVTHQRKQIQTFAAEINTLKERLVVLDQFEKKIRVMASINNSNEHDGLFGVGGSTPEDINPKIELTQKHNQMLRQMHRQVDQLESASQTKHESMSALLAELERQKNILAHTPTIRPAKGWISSRFGYRVSPFTEKREFHKGLDIANRMGTPIVATADGVVTFIGIKGQLGKVMIIDHGYGVITRFAHIDKALKIKGELVNRGDVIAQMGNSGRSTGPHLHYEVHLNGVPINPEKYIMN
jgi:murein DD-endopeptidase MepM/ murein hydrolase activator NlpD